MVSKDEAEATFRSLISTVDKTTAGTVVKSTWNYKIIVAVVLILLIGIGVAVWWWFRTRKIKPSMTTTPAIGRNAGSRVASGSTAPNSK